MSIATGTYEVGPRNGELLVNTRRTGGAAKAGHDLVLEVTSWNGTLVLGQQPSDAAVTLHAAGDSLRVREGSGGIKSLDDDDKQNIEQTIDDEVLRRTAIDFRSTAAQSSSEGGGLRVRGELGLAGHTEPAEFALEFEDDGVITGRTTIKQSDWGIKPYSALFGALKVADEVEVTFRAKLADQSR